MKKPLTTRDTNWPDDFDDEKRVHVIAGCIRQPRTTRWIATRADVDEEATRRILDEYEAVRPHTDDDDKWLLDGPARYEDAAERIQDHIQRWLQRADDTPVDIDEATISKMTKAAEHVEAAASLLDDGKDGGDSSQ